MNATYANRLLGMTMGLVLVITMMTVLPATAAGKDRVHTHGEFKTFAAGLDRGFDISGRAEMARTQSRTVAKLSATGLKPNTTYPAHVHNKPCSVDSGGGHYQHVVGGPVDPVNEIWLSFTTNADGFGIGRAHNDFVARPEAQSVVIHDTDGTRLACANLR